ncbi:MAG: hypothetical protein HYT36_01020 [Candidatus Staskawiczbacteria bacterium]|nr:hypothetical protein [Candidatus Staskawiczbacteria bacterium]
MNKAFSKIWIVVIAAIIIGGGVLAWQQGWLIIQDREEGGWKTYTNKQYAFEIKYPSDPLNYSFAILTALMSCGAKMPEAPFRA